MNAASSTTINEQEITGMLAEINQDDLEFLASLMADGRLSIDVAH